jgi:hypothetical protein
VIRPSVASVTWTAAGQLHYWVRERSVGGAGSVVPDGHHIWIEALLTSPSCWSTLLTEYEAASVVVDPTTCCCGDSGRTTANPLRPRWASYAGVGGPEEVPIGGHNYPLMPRSAPWWP